MPSPVHGDLSVGLSSAARLVCQAEYLVALTGAGVSTRSGIPDFRSPGSGLWERHDPMEVASIDAFRLDPGRFYRWIRPLAEPLARATPNAAHRALARLESAGQLKALITQNIDGLHQRAGSGAVLELHGSVGSASCTSCGWTTPAGTALRDYLASGDVPRCSQCQGAMKPDVVLLGEELPSRVVAVSLAHLRAADVVLIAGSSLETAPAAQFPLLTLERGGKIVIANLTGTYLDRLAEVVLRGDISDTLPRLVDLCLGPVAGE